MPLTPLQQAQALYAERPLQERFANLHAQMAYIDALDVAQAPILLIRAEPDNPLGEDVELTFGSADFLDAFKALVLPRLRKSSQEMAAAIRAAGLPAGCTSTETEFAPGVTVTIVHSSPPIARSESDVVLD